MGKLILGVGTVMVILWILVCFIKVAGWIIAKFLKEDDLRV